METVLLTKTLEMLIEKPPSKPRKVCPAMCDSDWLAAAGRVAARDKFALPEAFAKCLEEQLCFDCKVHVGGSVGRNTATLSASDVDLVVTFESAPRKLTRDWAPSLLSALEAMIPMVNFSVDGNDVPITVTRADFHLDCEVDGRRMRVLVAPMVHRQHTAKTDWTELGQSMYAATDLPFTLWVRSQPPHVLHAIRLVKEWAAEKPWSSPYLTPPPSMLDLLVISAAADVSTVGELVHKVHASLKSAERACVTWSKPVAWHDGAAPVVRPFVQDPFHPTRNHADVLVFDPSELQAFARAADSLVQVRVDDETASFVSATSESSTVSGTGTSASSSDWGLEA
jgi:predicted nucleotidyltransferase